MINKKSLIHINDVLLVFPPLTEARLFPYNSLPAITSYLRQRDRRVAQLDLNLELTQKLLTSEHLSTYAARLPLEPQSLHVEYRRAFARFGLECVDRVQQIVFQRNSAKVACDTTQEVRIARQLFDLLTETSPLRTLPKQVDHAMDYVEAVHSNYDDITLGVLRDIWHTAIEKYRPRVLAFSIPFFSQLLPSLLLAKWTRDLSPQTKIIIGGQQVMLWHPQLSSIEELFYCVDYLGIGKGEETLHQLLNVLDTHTTLHNVPDIVFKLNGVIEKTNSDGQPTFNSLPVPDFSDLPIHGYMSGETQLGLTTCIGCYWGRCAFCSYGRRSFDSHTYEQATPQVIAGWVEQLIIKYGAHRVNFIDENTNLKLIVSAMRLLRERGLNVEFSTRNRLERSLVNLDFCNLLATLGCVLMSCGYETNSQRLLDKFDKGVSASDYQLIIDNLHAAGITLRLSVMGNLPSESQAEFECSQAFLKHNANKIGIDVLQTLVVEPNTPLAQMPSYFNITLLPHEPLVGNEVLSYGGGRFGYSYTIDESTDQDVGLNRMREVFTNVRPEKNDELPPKEKIDNDAERIETLPNSVILHPWVKIVTSADSSGNLSKYIIDLLWQRFFKLPDILLEKASIAESQQHIFKISSQQNGALLDKLVWMDLGSSFR